MCDISHVLEKFWDWNSYLYKVAAPDLIAAQKSIGNFMISQNFVEDSIYYGKAGYDCPGEIVPSKGQIVQIVEEKTILILLLKDYLKYCHQFQDRKKNMQYIFVLDLSIYNLNRIDGGITLNYYDYPLDNTATEDFPLELCNPGLYAYFQRENFLEHCKILCSSLEENSFSWQYIKDNFLFLSHFLPELIINSIIHQGKDPILTNISRKVIHGKAIVLLCQYEKCKYSFFPEKKALICNYLYNMLQYISC